MVTIPLRKIALVIFMLFRLGLQFIYTIFLAFVALMWFPNSMWWGFFISILFILAFTDWMIVAGKMYVESWME